MFALVAGAYAQHDSAHAEVVRSESVVNPDSYKYNFETSQGIVGGASGQLKQVGSESALVSQGEFGW